MNQNKNQSLGSTQAVRETQVSQQVSRISDANERLAKASEHLVSRLQSVTIDRDTQVAKAAGDPPRLMLVPLADRLCKQADIINANAERLEELANAVEL